ncbi:peptidase M75 superfamily protein [Aequorivita sp. H23M31]|uniref:Peptidase M75 superfamily protein n=1 Tax=Aequorivita ciconiae TaxID=2494375 RepID=A0A410G1L6_9FLAO|nr:imelysin family protein [Aequorivita sp. H23M31]QAA81141.1 peptidase M75 superfamily protein [Aequorivita sp. H23M31]
MKYLKFGSIVVAFLFVLSSCKSNDSNESTDNFDRGAMLANWADNIIIPAYTSFDSKVNDLKTKTNEFTSNPTEGKLQDLRNSWEAAYVSFQNVSMFEIGKAEELRFRNRLNVYPTDVPQIEGFISSGTYNFDLPSTIDAQGFPALDYMINGLGENDTEILSFYTSNANATGYKNYLQKLSETISSQTDEVLTSWTAGYRDVFVANTASSALGAVDKFTNAYIFYYEKALRAGKVGIPAGVYSNGVLPQNVEAFYKKDISKELLMQALDATQNFFNGKKFGGSANGPSYKTYLDYLNTIKNGEDLSVLINNQFDAARAKINTLKPNFVEQIATDNSKMLETFDELQRNVVLMKVDMVQALNIAIDYVDADGD